MQKPHTDATTSVQDVAESGAPDDAGARGGDKSTTPSAQSQGTVLRPEYAQCRTKALPSDLARVVKAWPELPEAIKAGVLAMVKAATGDRR